MVGGLRVGDGEVRGSALKTRILTKPSDFLARYKDGYEPVFYTVKVRVSQGGGVPVEVGSAKEKR